MGLLAAIRDLRRRLRVRRVVTLTHCRGLPDPGVRITRDSIDEVVRAQIAAGRLRVVSRHRLTVAGWRWRFRFPPPGANSEGG